MSLFTLFRSITAAATLVALLQCTANNPPVAGPSTSQGNPQVVAVVVDKNRAPVNGVTMTVFLLPAASDSLSIPAPSVQVLRGTTNSKGEFFLDSLTSGYYAIEAHDVTSNRRALNPRLVITKDNKETVTDTLTLDITGEVKGVVMRLPGSQNLNQQIENGGIMVIIQELGISALTPTTGNYTFTDLPAGTYTLFYYATNLFFSEKRTITINAGTVFIADTVQLRPYPSLVPPRNFTVRFDTLAGVVHLAWSPVRYDKLRWYEIERLTATGKTDSSFTTTDTVATDSLVGFPSRTTFNYVIKSVDQAFNKSVNAGPVEIKLP